MTVSIDIAEEISSAIVYAFMPEKTWCEESTYNEITEALLAVINGEIHKLAHMQSLNQLDSVLAKLQLEVTAEYIGHPEGVQ
jgi:hypothetical protein